MYINWKMINQKGGPYFLIIFFVLIISFAYRRCHTLDKYGKYTIGITIRYYYTGDALKNIIYNYTVNNKLYKGDNVYNGNYNCQVPGGRYFVKFSSKKPSVSELLQDKPVPDSIKEAPPGGWDKLPLHVPQ